MANTKPWIAVLAAFALVGCVSAQQTRGTLIGAAAGAALGAGTGALVSNEKLLGSPKSEASGDISLDPGPTIGAGALIGVVFGALVGAMITHSQGTGEAAAPDAQAQAQSTQPAAF